MTTSNRTRASFPAVFPAHWNPLFVFSCENAFDLFSAEKQEYMIPLLPARKCSIITTTRLPCPTSWATTTWTTSSLPRMNTNHPTPSAKTSPNRRTPDAGATRPLPTTNPSRSPQFWAWRTTKTKKIPRRTWVWWIWASIIQEEPIGLWCRIAAGCNFRYVTVLRQRAWQDTTRSGMGAPRDKQVRRSDCVVNSGSAYAGLFSVRGMKHLSSAVLQNKKSCKSKRVRTIFTPEQLERLEAEFERQQYMVGPERLYLAHTLQLTEAQVSWSEDERMRLIWFCRLKFGFKIDGSSGGSTTWSWRINVLQFWNSNNFFSTSLTLMCKIRTVRAPTREISSGLRNRWEIDLTKWRFCDKSACK